MAVYPGAESERRIAFKQLHDAVQGIFAACGMDSGDASLLAHSLAWADLRGIHSHGVLRVPDYVAKLRTGGVDPRGRPHVVKDNRAALVIDGGNSMGQIGAHFAMQCAIGRAREQNVALAAVRGSNHCGALSYFACQALNHGMIGVAASNALPTMAPWGGKDKIAGINPLAVAIPTRSESPVVLDCAFSYSSHGKIRVLAQKGFPIPATWAFDSDGSPTTDAHAALDGLLQPIGEYKGVGLAIIFGLLSSLLSGAAYGTELGNMTDGPLPGRDGHFVMAIRVDAFEDLDVFKDRVDAAVRQIRLSRPVREGTPLLAPGGLEAAIEGRYRWEGIPLNEETLSGIEDAARAAGAPCEW
jgi:LDH2 family malate/lactate/ureidoglycolate dehydrogenase